MHVWLLVVAVLLFAQELFKLFRKGVGRWKFRFGAAVVFVFKHGEVADGLIVALNCSVVQFFPPLNLFVHFAVTGRNAQHVF